MRPGASGGRGDSIGFHLHAAAPYLSGGCARRGESPERRLGAACVSERGGQSGGRAGACRAGALPHCRPLMGSEACDSGASARWKITCPQATPAPDGKQALFCLSLQKEGGHLSGFREELNLVKEVGDPEA